MFDKMQLGIVLLCSVFVSLVLQVHCAVLDGRDPDDQEAGDKSAPLDVIEYFQVGLRSDFADTFGKDNSQYTNADADADKAESWVAELAESYRNGTASYKSKELEQASNVLSHKNVRCSQDLALLVLNFLNGIKRFYRNQLNNARYIARERLESCASKFITVFDANPKSKLEWSMDSFFRIVSAAEPDERSLLRHARAFNFKKMPNPDKICRAARAINKLEQSDPDYWREERGARELDSYLDRTYTINCEEEVPQFFDEICYSGRPYETGLEHLNMARALGAELEQLAGVRMQKFNEYMRICWSVYTSSRTIEAEMAKESKDVVEPE